jgi:hypothetical protein
VEKAGNDALFRYEKDDADPLELAIGGKSKGSPAIARSIFSSLDAIGGSIALAVQTLPRSRYQGIRELDVSEAPASWKMEPRALTIHTNLIHIGADVDEVEVFRRSSTSNIMFHGNQATLDVVQRRGVAVTAVALRAADDAACSDNQVNVDLAGGFMHTSVYVFGATAGLTGNAIIENAAHALSGLVYGHVLAAATGNRSTHCITVNSSGDKLAANNLTPSGFDCVSGEKIRGLLPYVENLLFKV